MDKSIASLFTLLLGKSNLDFRSVETNFLLLNELTCTLLTNEVFTIKYQVTMAEYSTRISLNFNAFPNSMVNRTMLVFSVFDGNILVWIVNYDVSILADFNGSLTIVNTKQFSRVSCRNFNSLVKCDATFTTQIGRASCRERV